MSLAGPGWVCLSRAASGPVTTALAAGPRHEEDNPGEEDDFDALLAASSFGSEQARAIREQVPPTAREHARRVLDGEEKCAPADSDVDDAVGGLVYGLAHGVMPDPTLLSSDTAGTFCSLLTASACSGHADWDQVVIFRACQTSMLWPHHRARLLQALIDHDAFASLRHDVAWKIIDCTFAAPQPPRVLLRCAELAVEQIDVSALAGTWLSAGDYRLNRSAWYGARNFADDAGRSGSAQPALLAAPGRAAPTAGCARPATTVQDDPSATARDYHRLRRPPARPPCSPARRTTWPQRAATLTALTTFEAGFLGFAIEAQSSVIRVLAVTGIGVLGAAGTLIVRLRDFWAEGIGRVWCIRLLRPSDRGSQRDTPDLGGRR
jgi:hypothetical protein